MKPLDRREFIARAAAGASVLAAAGVPAAATAGEGPASSRASSFPGLADPVFRPLPLGAIQPRGWLARQLRIQASGLSGHLDEFWPDVGQSKWFGGDAEGWERAPYWLDGVIPLAWTLDDAALKEKISGYVGQIIERQRPDGWFEPCRTKGDLPMTSPWPNGPGSTALKIKIPMFDSTDTESMTAAETNCLLMEPISNTVLSVTGTDSSTLAIP